IAHDDVRAPDARADEAEERDDHADERPAEGPFGHERILFRLSLRVEPALQDEGGGAAVDDLLALPSRQVGLDQRPLDGGGGEALVRGLDGHGEAAAERLDEDEDALGARADLALERERQADDDALGALAPDPVGDRGDVAAHPDARERRPRVREEPELVGDGDPDGLRADVEPEDAHARHATAGSSTTSWPPARSTAVRAPTGKARFRSPWPTGMPATAGMSNAVRRSSRTSSTEGGKPSTSSQRRKSPRTIARAPSSAWASLSCVSIRSTR